MWQGINQRKFPRVSYKCLIRISTDSEEVVIDTFTENLGVGGICVALDKDFGLFEKVDLEIFLSGKETPIHCSGSIVWVVKRHATTGAETDSFDTGIEFVDVSETDLEQIQVLVENILNT